MLSKRRIAILVSGLFLGAGIGMAALDESASSSEAEAIEEQPAAQVEAPAETQAQPSEPTAAPAPTITAAAVQAVTFGNVFPRSADDGSDMLPALAAYLEQRQRATQVASAQRDARPASAADQFRKPLEAVTRFVDRVKTAIAQPSASDSATTNSVQ